MKTRVAGSLMRPDFPGQPIAHLDEDALTLAVEAGRRALQEAGLEPDEVQYLHIGERDASAWAEHARLALGARNARIGPVTEKEVSPGLGIHVEYGHGPTGRAHAAEAKVEGIPRAHTTTAALAFPPSAAKSVDREFLDKLHASEAKSLAQVPMGAYVPRGTWDASLEARYRLLVSTCAECKRSSHPPFPICPRCGRPTTIAPHLEGVIHTFTTISKGAGPTEFDEWQALDGDYVVAIVDLAPGVRVAGMMTSVDPTTVKIGQRVRGVLRRLYAQEGAWRYGTKFQPLDDPTGR